MVAVVAAGLGMVACGLDKPDPWLDDGPPAFSAANLGKGPVTANMLTPAEREALARERGAPDEFGDDEVVAAEGDADPFADEEKGSEKTGKLALSLLTVGLSLAAAAAPYLLF